LPIPTSTEKEIEKIWIRFFEKKLKDRANMKKAEK